MIGLLVLHQKYYPEEGNFLVTATLNTSWCMLATTAAEGTHSSNLPNPQMTLFLRSACVFQRFPFNQQAYG